VIDFKEVKPWFVTKEFVLSKVSDSVIFYHYFGPFEIRKKTYKSVFSKDRNPSTGFYISKSKCIKYNDLRTRENWDCFAFVAKLNNINYGEAIYKVAKDFGLVGGEKSTSITKEIFVQAAKIDKEIKEKTIIQIVPERWTDEHLGFWRMYDATKAELIQNEIYPVRDLYINGIKIFNKNNHLRFAYRIIYEGEEYIKIYSPKDEKMKWISNIPLHIPFGLDSLPKQSKTLIITKSVKDRIVLLKLFDAVIATQNESEAAFPETLIQKFNTEYEFEQKIIFWDNDETGINNCKRFNDRGFGYFNIPNIYRDKYKIKDASDYVSYFGIDALKELFIQKKII
jgi:hypothetical protein